MHSKIIEISKRPIDRDDYISIGCFDYEEYDHFADYIQGVEQERENDIMSWIDEYGIFNRKGRKLTLLDLNGFMEEWRKAIITRANNIDFTEGLALYKLEEIIKETHKQSELMFYFEDEFMTLGRLAFYLYNNYKVCDKFYIGGILDYHY
jgi:hypothetical protein